MQADLFSNGSGDLAPPNKLNLDPQGECFVLLFQNFYSSQQSTELFQQLIEEIPWQRDKIKIAGRILPIPRLQAWFGNSNAQYSYSGIQLTPTPFTPCLRRLKSDIEAICAADFNSLLANLYRNGNDSVSWHSDDEKELGTNPIIASLSLGASRRFSFKHKTNKAQKPIHIDLNNGDLLIMAGATQHQWLHQVPKSAQVKAPRINLTFRKICVK